MEELKITVAKPTAALLHKVANEASIPIGEVVDRLVLDVAPDNPDSAFIVAAEQYLICTARLNQKDSATVFANMCALFLGIMPSEDLDDMIAGIKEGRLKGFAPEPLTEEERTELRKTLKDILHLSEIES